MTLSTYSTITTLSLKGGHAQEMRLLKHIPFSKNSAKNYTLESVQIITVASNERFSYLNNVQYLIALNIH